MRTTITITDLTRMKGRRVCVAGVLPDRSCVRPQPPRTNLIDAWLFRHQPRVVKPFAVLELELIRPAPNLTPPHAEDWEIEPAYAYCHDLTTTQRYELLHSLTSSHVRSVFDAGPGTTMGTKAGGRPTAPAAAPSARSTSAGSTR